MLSLTCIVFLKNCSHCLDIPIQHSIAMHERAKTIHHSYLVAMVPSHYNKNQCHQLRHVFPSILNVYKLFFVLNFISARICCVAWFTPYHVPGFVWITSTYAASPRNNPVKVPPLLKQGFAGSRPVILWIKRFVLWLKWRPAAPLLIKIIFFGFLNISIKDRFFSAKWIA